VGKDGAEGSADAVGKDEVEGRDEVEGTDEVANDEVEGNDEVEKDEFGTDEFWADDGPEAPVLKAAALLLKPVLASALKALAVLAALAVVTLELGCAVVAFGLLKPVLVLLALAVLALELGCAVVALVAFGRANGEPGATGTVPVWL